MSRESKTIASRKSQVAETGSRAEEPGRGGDSVLGTRYSVLAPDSRLPAAMRRLEEAGIERPLFEAQLLLAHALDVSRADILRGLDRDLTAEEAARFEALVTARAQRVPLAYLRGTQAFYGLEFEVTPAVLVPRPETELLVEFAVATLRGQPGATLIDVGTGSGCIAIAAAVHLPEAQVVALDLSAEALAVAQRNAARLGVAERVRLLRGSLLEAMTDGSAEMIVSNPPYIPSEEVAGLQPEVRDYEPRLALDGGSDGFVFHRGVLAGARRVLKPGGYLALEVALGQAAQVAALLAQGGLTEVRAERDLAGIERMVAGRQPIAG